MKLNVKALALAGGILWGLSVFALTWLSILMGYGSEQLAGIVKAYYLGYSVTPLGSVIGAVYGFFDAGIGLAVLGLLYNKLAGK